MKHWLENKKKLSGQVRSELIKGPRVLNFVQLPVGRRIHLGMPRHEQAKSNHRGICQGGAVSRGRQGGYTTVVRVCVCAS